MKNHKDKKLRIAYGSINDLRLIFTRFVVDFPAAERKPLTHLEHLMKDGHYKLIIAKHEYKEEIIGYAMVFQHNEFLWLDYIAIDDECRGKGYGTQFMNSISDFVSSEIKGMFIEVEKADSKDFDTLNDQISRIKFYESLGAVRLGINYAIPYKEGSFILDLYIRPRDDLDYITKTEIKDMLTAVFGFIHSDVPGSMAVLNTFIDEVEAVKLKKCCQKNNMIK